MLKELLKMVTLNTLRTCVRKQAYSEEKNKILDFYRSQRVPETDEIPELTLHVRTYFWCYQLI